MASRKFRPPNTRGARFKPPQPTMGETAPDLQAPTVHDTVLAKLDHRFGTETLIKTATGGYALEITGAMTNTSRIFVTDQCACDSTARRRVDLDLETATDWGRAHCLWWPR